MAIHVPSYYKNEDLIPFIQELENSFCRIKEIKKIILRKSVGKKTYDSLDFLKIAHVLNLMNPQCECYFNRLDIQQNHAQKTFGSKYNTAWLWHQTINMGFKASDPPPGLCPFLSHRCRV